MPVLIPVFEVQTDGGSLTQVATDQVRKHFTNVGLTCNDPEKLKDGIKILGLYVSGEKCTLVELRERDLFNFCHDDYAKYVFCMRDFQLCGRFRDTTVLLKRRANATIKGWDEITCNARLTSILTKTISIVHQEDHARGTWCVRGQEIRVWVDAISLATGLALGFDGESSKMCVGCVRTGTRNSVERCSSSSPIQSNGAAPANRYRMCAPVDL